MSDLTLDQVKRELRNIAEAIEKLNERKRRAHVAYVEERDRLRKVQAAYNERRKELIGR